MSFSIARVAAFATAAVLLAACGGGSAGSGVPAGVTPAGSTARTLATSELNGAPGFVNAASLSVYIFDQDLTAPGTSTCNGLCASSWPHVAPPSGVALSAGFATITRADGSTQLTYDGRPLYTFAGDSAPGQANGDGLTEFGGRWHLSRPAGSSTGTSPNPPNGY